MTRPIGLERFSADRPLVLVTDYSPDTPGGGAVILRSLIGPEERARMVWATPAAPLGGNPGADPSTAWLRRGTAGRGRRSLFLDTAWYARDLADEVLELARARGASAFWVLMHGAGVSMAARLVQRGTLPVHLTVHDDPAFAVAIRSRRYLALTPWIERDFARAMRGAASVDVVGKQMAERYRRRYGVDAVIVHRGMAPSILADPRFDGDREGLRVGILGNTYHYGQLPVLARAVARAGERIGVQSRVAVLGRSFGERLRAEMNGRPQIEVIGHLDEPRGVEFLRRCFLLYLNYPFNRRDGVLRQTSFPTKLTTYIQATRPILLHAPTDSSVAPLAEMTGYVHPWTSMDEDEGVERLVSAWTDRATWESAYEGAESVRATYYDLDRNRATLFQTLDALVPPPAG